MGGLCWHGLQPRDSAGQSGIAFRPHWMMAYTFMVGIVLFASLVLPVQITLLVMFMLAIGLTMPLRRVVKHPIAISLGICAFLGIPLLFLIGMVVDSFRYGEFHYDDASGLNDSYVHLPSDSTKITLHKYASGHEMKFRIAKSSLEAWMTEITSQRNEYSDAKPFKLDVRSENDRRKFIDLFGHHGWRCPDDAVIYRGWRSARGGGFDVWFSDLEGIAFINAGYW